MDYTARVYRNLNNGQWSIQQRREGKWVVVGYAEHIDMLNPVTRQSVAGRDRARRDGVRNVHCMVEGTLSNVRAEPMTCTKAITYNPFKHDTLVYRDTGRDFAAGDFAQFTKEQTMYVYQ